MSGSIDISRRSIKHAFVGKEAALPSSPTYFYKYNPLYCRGLVTAQGHMRGHLLKCWQRVLALCMSTPALLRVGRGQPEPESVVRP